MLGLAIIIFLIIGFFVGLKRGFILQIFHLLGFIIAYVAATSYYEELSTKLILWIPYPDFGNSSSLKVLTGSTDMESAFYRAIAFVIIFLAVKILFQIIGSMLDFIAHLPVLKQLNLLAGGVLGFCEVYLVIFILLYIGALVPIGFIQDAMDQSTLAKAIVNHTPILSQQIKSMWIEYTNA
jgi:uncharacterized membrane protein required for colicin V production